MYTFEYRFYPKSFEESFIEDFDSDMQWFISALSKNGQILSDYQNTVKFDDHYAYRVVAPDLDSLDIKYHNKYCGEFLKKLTDKSAKEPELELIGKNYDTEDSCECDEINHYILFTTYVSNESPIICGNCLKNVSLYKLPKSYDDEEYWDVRWWQRLYQACDTQFMGGVGERHGYRMMNNPDSQLSIEGLRICAFFEERTKKPFYYYLHKYYRKNKPNCPKCGHPWENTNKDKIHFDFVCQDCRLVSDIIK